MKSILFLALCSFCFGSSVESKLRITGDKYAEPGEFPYQVSIQLDGQHWCGGSLIGKKHVLTAAHCTHNFIVNHVAKSRMKIIVGTIILPGGIAHDVDRISHHGDYIHSDVAPVLYADVAIIRLKNEIVESKHVSIIALPPAGQMLSQGQKLIVSGFGTSSLEGPTSSTLKKMTTYSVSRAICKKYYPNSPMTGGLFCAAFAPGYGVCRGDSGGPLTVDKKVIIGLVSGGSSVACGAGIPDLITYVGHYLDFIHSELARKD